MTSTTPLTAVEFHGDRAAGTITVHLNGQPSPPFGSTADVRGVKTLKTMTAILTALDDAMQRGARHGECDQKREMAALLSHKPLPATHTRYENAHTCDGWAVARIDGFNDPHVILTGTRPAYVGSDVTNTLERAFKIGGIYGHPTIDGLARPLPLPNGNTLTAVEITRRALIHTPAHAHAVAQDLHGTQITVRVTSGTELDAYVVFHRHDGGTTTPAGRLISPPDHRARWLYATDTMTTAQLSAWDGEPDTRRSNPNPTVAAWLTRTAALRTP
jgi:hypothetical protein